MRPIEVLDVGCGTGYSTMVLAKFSAFVTALECDPDLAAEAQEILKELAVVNTDVVCGPLEEGWQTAGPFDVIFVNGQYTAGAAIAVRPTCEGWSSYAVVGEPKIAKVTIHTQATDGPIGARPAFDASVGALPGFDPMRQAFIF